MSFSFFQKVFEKDEGSIHKSKLELLVQIEAIGVAVPKCGIQRETGSEIGSANIDGYFKENKLMKETIKKN